jgi:hypothetical protein
MVPHVTWSEDALTPGSRPTAIMPFPFNFQINKDNFAEEACLAFLHRNPAVFLNFSFDGHPAFVGVLFG